jgi:aspartyl-tRNA(Asn)/glutamyl-tRNA(Gln) amidotransferase subunit C
MALTMEEVTHVARLARLRLDSAELERMREQLNAILDYMQMLEQVDVQDVPPTAQVTGLTSVLRTDTISAGLSQEAALANAPAQRKGMFAVRPVFDE